MIAGLASLTYPAAPVAATERPVANSEAAAQVAQGAGWTGPTPVSPSSVYGTGAYTPPVYNPFYYTPGTGSPQPVYPLYNPPVAGGLPPVYNAPLAPPPPPAYSLFNAPVMPPPPPAYPSVYNAPWEPGGFYFGPTGSLSALQDSDVIKRFEARTTDTLWTSSSRTGTSTNWLGSTSSSLTSTPWGLSPEGGSKKRLLTSSLGYDVGARAGYQWGNFRGEFQFDYANNSVDTFENPRRMTDFVMRDGR